MSQKDWTPKLYSFFNFGVRLGGWVGGEGHAPVALSSGKRTSVHHTGGREGAMTSLDGC